MGLSTKQRENEMMKKVTNLYIKIFCSCRSQGISSSPLADKETREPKRRAVEKPRAPKEGAAGGHL